MMLKSIRDFTYFRTPLLLTLLLSGILCFQPGLQTAAAQQNLKLSDGARISLITVYPGDQLHNMFGHSALRVQDSYHGFDLLYNYGTFHFDSTFLPKFIYGKLDYMLWVSDIRRELRKYQEDGRTIVEQELRFDIEQKQAVFDFLQYNALDANRYYRYDFLFDNCSTRIRDLMERIMGTSIMFKDLDKETETFRHLLDPYLTSQPFLDAGIDLGLALPTDRVATNREKMFLPLHLMEAFDDAILETGGIRSPLVGRKRTLFEPVEQEKAGMPPFLLYGTTWLIFLLALWVSNSKSPAMENWRLWFDKLLFGFAGIAGLLALFLWFVALHEVTNYNWNLLWLWPTHLILLFALRKKKRWIRPYLRVHAFILFITVLGWFFWPQEMHTAYIPLLLALAVRSFWWGWSFQPTDGSRSSP